MKIEKGTLFSLSNETLKKERPYSLLIMQIGFILECVCYAVAVSTVFYFLFFVFLGEGGRSYYSEGLFVLIFFSLFVLIYSRVISFILRKKWRMQLWIYDVFCFPLASSCVEYYLESSSLDLTIYLIVFFVLSLPIVAAWRVRSFLRSQPETEDGNEEINTLTLHEFFIESMIKTKRNTLFSIKSHELRKKCPFSLLLTRLYCVLIFLFFIGKACVGLLSLAYTSELTLTSFPSIVFFVGFFILWSLLELRLWAYNIMAIYSFFSFLGELGLRVALELSSQHLYLYLIPFVGTIAAWRVIACILNEQREKNIEQENAEENQLPTAEHTNESTVPEEISEKGLEKEPEQALEEDLGKKPEKEPESII